MAAQPAGGLLPGRALCVSEGPRAALARARSLSASQAAHRRHTLIHAMRRIGALHGAEKPLLHLQRRCQGKAPTCPISWRIAPGHHRAKPCTCPPAAQRCPWRRTTSKAERSCFPLKRQCRIRPRRSRLLSRTGACSLTCSKDRRSRRRTPANSPTHARTRQL